MTLSRGIGKGKGLRISKPVTAKQRAQADRMRQQRDIAFKPSTAGLPTRSWWLEGFTDAKEQQARMKQSRLGQSDRFGVE